MNRRQFTASLAALVATPALPVAARMPALAAPAVPPGAYAWATLIARAQMQCSPEMLARCLNLTPAVAKVLFKDMVVDGVLRAPGASGIAKAANPFEGTGLGQTTTTKLKTKVRDTLRDAFQADDETPLVNPEPDSLGCADTAPEDLTDASTDEHPEEGPATG